MSRPRLLAIFVIAILLLSGVYGLGVATAPNVQQLVVNANEPPDVQQQFKIFWEAWSLADEHFVDRKALDTKMRVYGAISGQLDALGDRGHTRFLSPEDLKQQRESIAGHFEGIGAELGTRDGHPTIVTPIDGSPAERAGVQAGDIIVSVNGEDTSQMTLQEVVSKIRGPRGTPVTISVIHPNQTSVVDLTIVRDQITVRSVVYHYLPQSQIGHLRISQFSSNAESELVAALKSLEAQGAKGLVVDVRNDPGGLLDQAISVTSHFLKEGDVLLEQDSDGQRHAYPVKAGGIATDIPIAVLINRGTASAAEIFAGAIKDHKRGFLLGERTFGTGTVLSTFNLSDGSALLLATQEWLTPNGDLIKSNGIVPDRPTALAPNALPLTATREKGLTEDEILAADAQLAAAVQALRVPVGTPAVSSAR